MVKDTETFRSLYPFTDHWLDIDGVRMHYVDEGPNSSADGAEKPVVVMVHGNPTWSFYFRRLIAAAAKEYRVIVPDHIGCGLSDKPQEYTYTLARHTDNLERLLEHLGVKRILMVMHDWGGAIGMGYALRHPEKMVGFMPCNTAVFYPPKLPLSIRMCRIPFWGAGVVRGLNGFLETALIFGTSQRKRFTADVRAGYLAPYDSWRNRVAIHRFVLDIPLEANHPTRAVVEALEAGLTRFQDHPVLLFWGMDDFCFTAKDYLPIWRRYFTRLEVHTLEKVGHFVIEDAHEQIIPKMLDFFRRLS